MKENSMLSSILGLGTKAFRLLLWALIPFLSYPAMAAAPPDPCQSIRDQIAALESQLQKAQQAMVSPYGKPGEPLKPVKDPEAAKLVKDLEEKIDSEQEKLSQCEAPPATPALAISAFAAQGIGAPDPQIAVGHKYFAAIDTSDLVFYDKATMKPVAAGPGFSLPSNPVRMTDVFRQFFDQMNKQMKLPANVCDTTHPQSSFPGGNFDNKFDPKHPNAAIPGCIFEAYDARVLYDEGRHRFWIEAAVRNELWKCPTDNPTHAEIGGFLKHADGTLDDPDPSDPTKMNDAKCHTDWSASWAHRFIVIAVSQVNSKGEEDLSKPFHEYALMDDYQDWPLMAVHNDYLLLTHKDAGDMLEVFNAQALADGKQDNTSMAVKPLLTLPPGLLATFHTQGIPFPIVPAGPYYPVNMHGNANGITYFVSSTGNFLTIFGLKAPANNSSGTPQLLQGAAINMCHDLEGLRHNPVYRNGKIYLATFECKTSNKSGCVKYISRILRVPVGLSSDGKAVQASGPGASGYLDYRIGNDSSTFSYEVPAIEVTKDDDMVVMFERAGIESGHLEPTSVRYSIFYNGKSGISPSKSLQNSVGNQIPPGNPASSPDPGGGGVVDLGAIVVDPDGKVWMSHAYADSGSYREIIGAVKP